MKTYRLIIDGGKEIDDEFYTSKTKLLKVISNMLSGHKIEVMEYDGTKGDELENYRGTFNSKLQDQGY